MELQPKPRVQVVNENDEIIGYKDRSEINKLIDIQRVSAIWLTNSKGEILIAQRKLSKAHDPGKWGPAAAGTLEEGDTYDSNAVKEIEEEIGLSGVELQKGPKQRVYIPEHKKNYFAQWYSCLIDKDAQEFILQDDEVEAVRWISLNDLEEELLQHSDQFIPTMRLAIDMFKTEK